MEERRGKRVIHIRPSFSVRASVAAVVQLQLLLESDDKQNNYPPRAHGQISGKQKILRMSEKLWSEISVISQHELNLCKDFVSGFKQQTIALIHPAERTFFCPHCLVVFGVIFLWLGLLYPISGSISCNRRTCAAPVLVCKSASRVLGDTSPW